MSTDLITSIFNTDIDKLFKDDKFTYEQVSDNETTYKKLLQENGNILNLYKKILFRNQILPVLKNIGEFSFTIRKTLKKNQKGGTKSKLSRFAMKSPVKNHDIKPEYLGYCNKNKYIKSLCHLSNYAFEKKKLVSAFIKLADILLKFVGIPLLNDGFKLFIELFVIGNKIFRIYFSDINLLKTIDLKDKDIYGKVVEILIKSGVISESEKEILFNEARINDEIHIEALRLFLIDIINYRIKLIESLQEILYKNIYFYFVYDCFSKKCIYKKLLKNSKLLNNTDNSINKEIYDNILKINSILCGNKSEIQDSMLNILNIIKIIMNKDSKNQDKIDNLNKLNLLLKTEVNKETFKYINSFITNKIKQILNSPIPKYNLMDKYKEIHDNVTELYVINNKINKSVEKSTKKIEEKIKDDFFEECQQSSEYINYSNTNNNILESLADSNSNTPGSNRSNRSNENNGRVTISNTIPLI